MFRLALPFDVRTSEAGQAKLPVDVGVLSKMARQDSETVCVLHASRKLNRMSLRAGFTTILSLYLLLVNAKGCEVKIVGPAPAGMEYWYVFIRTGLSVKLLGVVELSTYPQVSELSATELLLLVCIVQPAGCFLSVFPCLTDCVKSPLKITEFGFKGVVPP